MKGRCDSRSVVISSSLIFPFVRSGSPVWGIFKPFVLDALLALEPFSLLNPVQLNIMLSLLQIKGLFLIANHLLMISGVRCADRN